MSRTNSIFPNDRKNIIMLMMGLSAMFFLGLTIQAVFAGEVIRMYISVMLIAVSFLFNIMLGTPGLILALAWNFLQIVTYIYEYNLYKETTTMYLIALAIMSMIISLLFRLFVARVSRVTDDLQGRIDAERARRRRGEDNRTIQDVPVRSSGLITRHDPVSDNSISADERQLSFSQGLDPLTTLPDRDKVIIHIGSLIDRNIDASRGTGDEEDHILPVYVIYLSIDGADEIKRREGHKRLDLFTQSMAHRIREIADSADMVGHISGTEFVISTGRGMTEDGLRFYIDSLCKAAALSFKDDSGSPVATVSAGYSSFPANGRFPGELLSKAESAMSEVQREGGGGIRAASVIRDPENRGITSTMKISEINSLITDAFAGDELRMVYQPRVDRDGKLTGFESFIRLKNIDTHELLDASVMTGNICRIGEFSLTHAISRLSRINRLGPNLTMTINLSAEQLMDAGITEDIRKAASESECNMRNLILDIPEESMIGSSGMIKPLLDEFTSMGINIALDNFGRGYSSLNNIPLLPISSMNLDGNFTSELDGSGSSGILTSTIIELMEEIDIPVCATGVESEHQYDTLRDYGCSYFQGKFICEPLEDDALEEYILSHAGPEPDNTDGKIGFELDI